MENIKYFYTEACPFCVKPKNYIEENNLDVELVDATSDKESQMELIKLGGKMQVPMLAINGEAMYESRDIMKWLKENM